MFKSFSKTKEFLDVIHHLQLFKLLYTFEKSLGQIFNFVVWQIPESNRLFHESQQKQILLSPGNSETKCSLSNG